MEPLKTISKLYQCKKWRKVHVTRYAKCYSHARKFYIMLSLLLSHHFSIASFQNAFQIHVQKNVFYARAIRTVLSSKANMTNTPGLCVLANFDKPNVPGCISGCYVVSVVLCQNLAPSLPFCREGRANVEIKIYNEQLLVFAYLFLLFRIRELFNYLPLCNKDQAPVLSADDPP